MLQPEGTNRPRTDPELSEDEDPRIVTARMVRGLSDLAEQPEICQTDGHCAQAGDVLITTMRTIRARVDESVAECRALASSEY